MLLARALQLCAHIYIYGAHKIEYMAFVPHALSPPLQVAVHGWSAGCYFL